MLPIQQLQELIQGKKVAFIGAGVSHKPVSYTHLAVYKRQHQRGGQAVQAGAPCGIWHRHFAGILLSLIHI